jgi:hypothetical protein
MDHQEFFSEKERLYIPEENIHVTVHLGLVNKSYQLTRAK